MTTATPYRQVRATYDETTIAVYQAYPPEIAEPALAERTGFEWALANSCLSHFDRKHYVSEAAWRDELRHSPVRIKWDPEQALQLQPKARSIQIGVSGDAVPIRQRMDLLHRRRHRDHALHPRTHLPRSGRRRSV